MPQSAVRSHTRLEALRPAIKREWETRLRAEAPASAIGNPDVLVFLMDETLNQLQRGLKRADGDWLHLSPPLVSPGQGHCGCSLNPLLNYYVSGELALRAIAAPALGREIAEVLLIFHALAQQEMQTLCSLCQRRGEPDCQLRALGPATGR